MNDQPAGIGHNVPPNLIEILAENNAQLRHELEKLAGRATHAPRKITDEADLGVIGSLVRDARALNINITAKRKAEKEPFLNAGREVDQYFNTLTDRVDRIVTTFQAIGDDYQREVAAKARAEAEARAKAAREEEARRIAEARKAEEAGRKANAAKHEGKAELARAQAEQAEATAQEKAADLTRVRTESGVIASAKEAWTFTITNYDEIPLDVLKPFLKREAVEAALRAAIKLNLRECKGVRIFKDVKASFR